VPPYALNDNDASYFISNLPTGVLHDLLTDPGEENALPWELTVLWFVLRQCNYSTWPLRTNLKQRLLSISVI
jgi:hypothetical protein